jgi:ArsR family transcriptional regulator
VITLETPVDVLRALGEPTRLRIVLLLCEGELTVTDLVDILGQSQPQVSRHLRQLADAGVVVRRREGAWAFYRLVDEGPGADMVASAVAAVAEDDPTRRRDRDRLQVVRERRIVDAAAYFEQIAPIWDEERSLHARQDEVEAAILAAAGPAPLGRIVDLGTGTGRMLQLLAPLADKAVGLDASHSMLAVARANLGDVDAPTELRQGDIHVPPLEPRTFDLVVIHQVLHYLDEPASAVAEAGRLLAPGGRVIVVDFAPHDLEFLRTEHAHRRLGISDAQMAGWAERCGLAVAAVRHLAPPPDRTGLVVTIWTLTGGSR